MVPTILHIPESQVVKAHLDTDEEDEWDLGRDIELDSQGGGDEYQAREGELAEEGESERKEPNLTWKPENDVDLSALASRDILDELEKLTGCELRLDGTAEEVLIFSTSDHDVESALEKLSVLENDFVSSAQQPSLF